MNTVMVRSLAVSLVLVVVGCGQQQSAPEPPPDEPAQPAPAANTGRVVVYVKGMTKALNLV